MAPQIRRRLLCCTALASSARRAAAADTLRFGLTPVFLDSDLELLSEFEAYLRSAIQAPVQLVKRRTYQEIVALLLAGELDAAWLCGFPYVQHADRLAVLAVPIHRGRPLYQSYVIAAPDTPAATLGALGGGIHAFSDPDSNSGYLVTRWKLARRDTTPERFFTRAFFAYSHRNVIRAVAAGLADSGSVDGYVWEVMTDHDPTLTRRTRVVERSEWHGFPPICCLRETREAPATRRLETALRDMRSRPLGARVLATLRLDGFGPGDRTLFAGIARMAAEVWIAPKVDP